MGPCPHALFFDLASDLSGFLRTVSGSELYSEAPIPFWPGISPLEVSALQLRASFLKKFQDQKSKSADKLALQKFLESNDLCRSFTFKEPTDSLQEIALNEAENCFRKFFESPGGDYWLSYDSISANIAPGPGASLKATGDSFYHKIAASPMTGTQRSLFLLYKREAAKYDLWLETEKIRSDHFGDFVAVRGNKLSYVPKTALISRTICTEPLLNMLVQKGIGACFEEMLDKRFGINLSTQPSKNQSLAKKGSLDGSFGTIDLSSASDSISMALLERICPRYILSWLREARSPTTTLPNGEEVQLHMVSSMGNAFTFPLQTILFSSAVIGVYRALGLELVYPRNDSLGSFGVFGDDIIVRREAYDLAVSVLQHWGFRVNIDKSYNDGPFRESCGGDFFAGHNVRGVYCQSLKTKQDVYSLINRLNDWSANQGIPLTTVIQSLLKWVRFLPVPPWESDVAGVKVPLHLVVKPKRDRNTGSIVYLRYLPRTKSLSLLNVGLLSKLPRGVVNNAPGILLTAVGGYARDGAIIERQRRVSFSRRASISPCWDYYNPLYSRLSSAGWRRWLSCFAALNLGKV